MLSLTSAFMLTLTMCTEATKQLFFKQKAATFPDFGNVQTDLLLFANLQVFFIARNLAIYTMHAHNLAIYRIDAENLVLYKIGVSQFFALHSFQF